MVPTYNYVTVVIVIVNFLYSIAITKNTSLEHNYVNSGLTIK